MTVEPNHQIPFVHNIPPLLKTSKKPNKSNDPALIANKEKEIKLELNTKKNLAIVEQFGQKYYADDFGFSQLMNDTEINIENI